MLGDIRLWLLAVLTRLVVDGFGGGKGNYDKDEQKLQQECQLHFRYPEWVNARKLSCCIDQPGRHLSEYKCIRVECKRNCCHETRYQIIGSPYQNRTCGLIYLKIYNHMSMAVEKSPPLGRSVRLTVRIIWGTVGATSDSTINIII